MLHQVLLATEALPIRLRECKTLIKMESLKHVYRVAFLELWTWTRQVYSCIFIYIQIYIMSVYDIKTYEDYIFLESNRLTPRTSKRRLPAAAWPQQADLAIHWSFAAIVDDLHRPKITHGSMLRCSSSLCGLDAVIPTTQWAPGMVNRSFLAWRCNPS